MLSSLFSSRAKEPQLFTVRRIARSSSRYLEPNCRGSAFPACPPAATTQNDAEDVAAALDRAGVECRFYHAGVAADNRKETQDWFINGNGVVVATIAFGMGIDKSNIRQVCHFHIPKTLENYS